MKMHADTTETVNRANMELIRVQASGNRAQLIEALRDYSDRLIWGIERIRTELDEWKKTVPPPEARALHTMVIQGLLKEMEGLTLVSSYYSSVIRYGTGDASVLNRSNTLLAEAWNIWQEAKYEMDNLARKVRN